MRHILLAIVCMTLIGTSPAHAGLVLNSLTANSAETGYGGGGGYGTTNTQYHDSLNDSGSVSAGVDDGKSEFSSSGWNFTSGGPNEQVTLETTTFGRFAHSVGSEVASGAEYWFTLTTDMAFSITESWTGNSIDGFNILSTELYDSTADYWPISINGIWNWTGTLYANHSYRLIYRAWIDNAPNPSYPSESASGDFIFTAHDLSPPLTGPINLPEPGTFGGLSLGSVGFVLLRHFGRRPQRAA